MFERVRTRILGVSGGIMRRMSNVIDLQERRVYSFRQIDDILNLYAGTSARWIDGYDRGAKSYPPVVREERQFDDVATWGEFVECRLLAEYRTAGVTLQRMRPAVERLRELTNSPYPLASAQLWVAPEGRELVARVQDEVGLARPLSLVLRTGQTVLDWSVRASTFERSVAWSSDDAATAEPLFITPDPQVPLVVVDPRRGYGDPVIRGRNVTTEVVRELVRAGESVDGVAEAYELTRAEVEAALAYELGKKQSA